MKLFAVLIWTTIEGNDCGTIFAIFSTKKLAEDFMDRNKTGYYLSGQSYTLVLKEMILDELPPGSK